METSVNQRPYGLSTITLAITLWGLLAFAAGYYRVFTNFPGPVFGFIVVGLLLALLTLYFRDARLRAFVGSIPLGTIALIHSLRIFGGWVFLANTNALPHQFALDTGWGDIMSGLLGLAVVITGRSKISLWLFNTVGTLDLLLGLATGFTLTLMGEQAMVTITILPIAIILLLIVPLLLFTHIVSFMRLGKLGSGSWLQPVE